MTIAEIIPTHKQHIAWQTFQDDVHTDILFGGAASGGKSYCACQIATVVCYELAGATIGLARKELTTLMRTTFETLMEVFEDMGIPQSDWSLNGKYNWIEFKNGSKIFLLDTAYKPSDPNFDRFGGLLLTHAFGEEIAEWDKRAWEVLQTRIGRNNKFTVGGKEIEVLGKFFGTCNPTQNWVKSVYIDPQRNGTMPDHRVFIQSKITDNPHVPDAYRKQLENIEDPTTKRRLLHGDWDYEDTEGVLMKTEYIRDLFSNTIVNTPEKYLIIDPAHLGRDTAVFSVWRGLDWYRTEVYAKTDGQELLQIAKNIAVEEQIPYSHILVDRGGGYGNPIIDFMSGVIPFIGNSTPIETKTAVKGFGSKIEQMYAINRHNYKTLKDQCGYKLAEMVNNHKITISCPRVDKEKLVQEMVQIKTSDPDTDGKLSINSKEKVKEAIGRSPDLSDTILMRMWFELRKDVDASDVFAERIPFAQVNKKRIVRNF